MKHSTVDQLSSFIKSYYSSKFHGLSICRTQPFRIHLLFIRWPRFTKTAEVRNRKRHENDEAALVKNCSRDYSG